MTVTRDRQYGYCGDGDDAASVVSDVDGGRDVVVVVVVAGSNQAVVVVFVAVMLPATVDDVGGYDDGNC